MRSPGKGGQRSARVMQTHSCPAHAAGLPGGAGPSALCGRVWRGKLGRGDQSKRFFVSTIYILRSRISRIIRKIGIENEEEEISEVNGFVRTDVFLALRGGSCPGRGWGRATGVLRLGD